MKYCAVAMKTESGDLYCYLIDYTDPCEVPVRIHEWLDDEMAYVYEIQVDSGIDADTDDQILSLIVDFIEKLQDVGDE